MPLFKSPPKSICILRLSAIGDVCHCVAAVQAIQKQWPETKITWIMGKVEAQLLSDLPNVNIIIFDKKTGFKGMKALWKSLKDKHFDALLHMQVALRSSVLTLGIKAKYKVGFNLKRAKEGQWLFTNKKIADTSSSHVLDSFFEFVYFLGIKKTTPTWHIPLSNEDVNFANALSSNKKRLVISPSASKEERNWTTVGYASIADYAEKKGYQVILCGSPTEKEVALGFQIEAQTKSNVINLIGKTSLKQLTAVLKEATIVLAPDSGPAHIATTQGTPVIGLYAHSNPKRTGPYLSLGSTVSVYEKHVQAQQGKPLSVLPWSTRAKGVNLMQDIKIKDVIKVFDNLEQETI
ncbi:MAG TPA: lipopolysaccharide heptosyltransferase family protein [Psychromonas hadalis]|nr:lipopolysaccharide heptosyltransferase family protein [Psychromonas hadalis]